MKIGANTNQSNLSMLNAQKSKGEISSSLEKIAALRDISDGDMSAKNIGSTMRLEISTLAQGVKNANEGIGYLQIADGILSSLGRDADKLNQLATSLNSGALSSSDSESIISQINKIKESMSGAVNNATYNGRSVFSGNFEVVTSTSATITAHISRPSISALDGESGDAVLNFIKDISKSRGEIGSAINTLKVSVESNTDAMVNLTQSTTSNSGVVEDYNELNTSFLKENAALYAATFNTESLKNKLDSLLA